MKKTLGFVCALVSASVCAADLDLNGTWAFRLEEGKSIEEVADPGFQANDAMAVPGCWDMTGAYYMKRGTALYRRTFTLEKPVANAWLVVSGMGIRGDFRIDGKSLGVHPYPYAKLELATGPLAAGEHVLFAALDNRFDWDKHKLIQPYYDFYLHGGFYHGVKLSFDNRRLFVRTRDYKTGLMDVEAVNFPRADFKTTLVFDGKNKVDATFKKGHAQVCVPAFGLWSPETPRLHTVSLADGDAAPVKARFGVRQIEARNRQIWLNGHAVRFLGVNRHESSAIGGAATTRALMRKDIEHVKDLGGNFIRGAHYQQCEEFLDLCDELGVFVWEESLGWGNGQLYTDGSKGDDVVATAREKLADEGFVAAQIHETREMVRASINHPCVVVSAFLNECGSQHPECKTLVDQLIETIRAEDTGHLVTFACNLTTIDICHANTDVVSYNLYPGMFPSKPGLPAALKKKVHDEFLATTRMFRERYPEKPIFVSESGTGGAYGAHDAAAAVGTEEYQCEHLGNILEVLSGDPDVCGYAVWQLNDNRTFHRNSEDEVAKGRAYSDAGLYDRWRRPKASVEVVRRAFANWGTRPPSEPAPKLTRPYPLAWQVDDSTPELRAKWVEHFWSHDPAMEVALWPDGKIPLKKGEGKLKLEDDEIWHKNVIVTDVNEPFFAFFPAQGATNAPCAVVLPGGGYVRLGWNKEGTEIADWFNAQGCAAAVLVYRCPDQVEAAVCDVQRAIRLLRANAKKYGINPNAIGVIGFSAGANLAVRAATGWRKSAYARVDAADDVSCRPDFQMPIYLWDVLPEDFRARKSFDLRPEYPVDGETPPAFIAQSQDDFCQIETSVAYFLALRNAKVPAALHVFPSGGHGYGGRAIGRPTDAWPDLAALWLNDLKKTW